LQKGDMGDQGIQGPKGDQGIQGPKGDQGAQGIQGAKGDQGTRGIQGPTGATGDQGPQGLQGQQGPAGFGIQGNRGPTGATGPLGVLIRVVQDAHGLTVGTVIDRTQLGAATLPDGIYIVRDISGVHLAMFLPDQSTIQGVCTLSPCDIIGFTPDNF